MKSPHFKHDILRTNHTLNENEWTARYLSFIRQGCRREEACRRAGVNHDSVARFAKRNPEFRRELQLAYDFRAVQAEAARLPPLRGSRDWECVPDED